MKAALFQLQRDEVKGDANFREHGITFELAETRVHDPHLLTVADLEHSDTEERWLSIGYASNGVVLSAAYLWSDADSDVTKIRLISARIATRAESRYYQDEL